MKASTILVVIGALRLIKKGLDKYIQQIPSNITIHELQKIKLLGTSHILRKALSIKYTSTSIKPSDLGMGSAFELSVVYSLMLKKIMLITKSTADSSWKVLRHTTGKIFSKTC